MAQSTPYLNLYKWDKDDPKINTINGITANAEKIDTELKSHKDRLDGIDTSLTAHGTRLTGIETELDTLQGATIAIESANLATTTANAAAEAATVAANNANGLVQEVETGLAQAVKSVNGTTPDANGNVVVEISGDTSTFATKTELAELAGTGRTTETVKGISDALTSHQTDYNTHKANTTVSAHLAKNIALEDTGANFTATEIEGAMTELFQSVSSGKNLLKTAVTDKGGTVTQAGTYPTFAELDTGIRSIAAVGAGYVRLAKSTVTASGGKAVVTNGSVAGFDFIPYVMYLKKYNGVVGLMDTAIYFYGAKYTQITGLQQGAISMLNSSEVVSSGTVNSVGIGAFDVQVPSDGSYEWFVLGE